MGQHFEKRGPAAAGETVAFGKLDQRQDRRHACRPASRRMRRLIEVKPYPPVLAIAVQAKERKDDVKLGSRLHQADRGGSFAHRRAQCRKPTRW